MGNEVTISAEQLQNLINRVQQLETAIDNKKQKSQKEMTDTDAYKILTGELKDLNHNKAAQALGLSYGQIYSCRLQYTFRHIHKKLQSEGFVNPWIQNKR